MIHRVYVWYVHAKKEKLSSVIWTWIVIGVLSAVVITGLVLGIIYLVELANTDEEETYEEQFPNAKLLTFEELDGILEAGHGSELHVSPYGTIYVLVYTASADNSNIKTYVDNAANACEKDDGKNTGRNGDNAFYVVNLVSEDNKDSSISSYSNLSSLSENCPYLLVISPENGDFEIVETITLVREINQTLINFVEGTTQE